MAGRALGIDVMQACWAPKTARFRSACPLFLYTHLGVSTLEETSHLVRLLI